MNNIDTLLEKYFDGETSLKEEQQLALYFQSGNIKSEHEQYKPLFQFIAIEKADSNPSTNIKQPKKMPLFYFAAACASIIIVVFIAFNWAQNTKIESVAYVNGKKIVDTKTLHNEALKAIISIEDDGDILESQIDLLDSFTQ